MHVRFIAQLNKRVLFWWRWVDTRLTTVKFLVSSFKKKVLTGGPARGVQGEHGLDGDVHGGGVEGLKHDLGHLFPEGWEKVMLTLPTLKFKSVTK